MSKNWYPVVNDEVCVGCGGCIERCPNGVYELKDAKPVVIHPDACPEGCKGCEDVCPVGAIQHIGDTTKKGCSCSCGCDCK